MFGPKVTLQGRGSTYFLAVSRDKMCEFYGERTRKVPVRVAAAVYDNPKFKVEGLEKVDSPVQNVKVKTFQLRFDLCH